MMKKTITKISYGFMALLMIASCETTDLDLTEDPNRLRLSDADPELLLNTLQQGYSQFIISSRTVSSRLTRIEPMIMFEDFSGNYTDFLNYERSSSLQGDGGMRTAWANYYTIILPNFNVLESLAKAEQSGIYKFNLAVANIIKAHTTSILVDQYGSIPYSEAGDFLNFPNPKLDDDDKVYAACFELLDEAIDILRTEPLNDNLNDAYFGGEATKWLKFANSLKLRMYKNTGNINAFKEIIDGGEFITISDNDMQYQYFDRPTEIFAGYPSDISNNPIPKSNWLMNTMVKKGDPRIRYYFYRQTDQTPGIDIPSDASVLQCSDETPPAHYNGFAYCAVSGGYIGRSHGNNTDVNGSDRTDVEVMALSGVYPLGGFFDDDRFLVASDANFSSISSTTGNNAILSILTAADIDFWRGQIATNASEKGTFLRAAMEKHIVKVQSFGVNDTGADLSFEPTVTEVGNYIDGIVNSFMAASGDDQENIFAEQYFISLYGNGLEAYNYYRKTGYPTTLSPAWNADPGSFPRSLPYPDKELNNVNIPAGNRSTMDQIFWDTNPASPSFPKAN